MALILLSTAAVLSQAPPAPPIRARGCIVPDYFESKVRIFDQERGHTKTEQGTYAFDRNGKKWARRESVYKDDDHKNAIQFQILADYNKGSEIIKNLKTEQCSEIKGLSESQWLRDLPDAYENAKHQGDVIIGSLAQAGYGVSISAWGAQYSSGNVKVYVDQQFVHPEPVPGTKETPCLPFTDTRISNHTAGLPSAYLNTQHTNIVLGISDPSIFDPPCTPPPDGVFWYKGSHHPEGAKTISTIAEIWQK